MTDLLHELVFRTADRFPSNDAVSLRRQTLSYEALAATITQTAAGLLSLGLSRGERVGIYLPKVFEGVASMFGAAAAGGVFVPINPILKAEQVSYILRDCNVRILVTTQERAMDLEPALRDCHDLRTVVLAGSGEASVSGRFETVTWTSLMAGGTSTSWHRVIDMDMAAILYTSGSTGKPKGVVLSHRNMVTGAKSVAQYLQNRSSDRLLAVLPFSFDYGFSQLSTAFTCGACAVLMDYLLPRDVIQAVARDRITGLAGVPPLWAQLAQLPWPAEAAEPLRYITNSGGKMPARVLHALRGALPHTQVFLMYGLTEAFRSTYLPPEEVDRRPDSIGKAIPNAEILVVREDGMPCPPNEPGELVHRGSLVAMGYWNDMDKTRERFRPIPNREQGLVQPEIAVWSGDTVRMDEEGYLYFVGRRDDMIKTSGYRVSPTEVEEVVYGSGLVSEAAAIGVSHPVLGQAVVVVAAAKESGTDETDRVLAACKERLPNFMVPAQVIWRTALPRNPNGKIDRKQLVAELDNLFQETDR